MLKSNTNTTVSGITMHNVGVFFIIDWTGNGNMVRLQRKGVAADFMSSDAHAMHCLAKEGCRFSK